MNFLDELVGHAEEIQNLDLDNAPEKVRNALVTAACRWLSDQKMVPKEIWPAREMSGTGLNCSIEPVTFIQNNDTGQWHVLLSQRPENDPFYSNQWCSPGKIELKGAPVTEMLELITKPDETGIANHNFKWAGSVTVVNDPRGTGFKAVLGGHWKCEVWIRVLNQFPEKYTGLFYPIYQLPNDLIAGHELGILPVAYDYLFTGRQSIRVVDAANDKLLYVQHH